MFDYEDRPLPESEAGGVRFTPVEVDNQTCQARLEVALANDGEWSFRVDRIQHDAVRRGQDIADDRTLRNVLASAIANPGQRISTLPLMPEAETRRVLVEWNATDKPFPSTATIHQLFEAQVQRTPDAIALMAGTDRLTYRELNARANQMAHQLRSLGVETRRARGHLPRTFVAD